MLGAIWVAQTHKIQVLFEKNILWKVLGIMSL